MSCQWHCSRLHEMQFEGKKSFVFGSMAAFTHVITYRVTRPISSIAQFISQRDNGKLSVSYILCILRALYAMLSNQRADNNFVIVSSDRRRRRGRGLYRLKRIATLDALQDWFRPIPLLLFYKNKLITRLWWRIVVVFFLLFSNSFHVDTLGTRSVRPSGGSNRRSVDNVIGRRKMSRSLSLIRLHWTDKTDRLCTQKTRKSIGNKRRNYFKSLNVNIAE